MCKPLYPDCLTVNIKLEYPVDLVLATRDSFLLQIHVAWLAVHCP